MPLEQKQNITFFTHGNCYKPVQRKILLLICIFVYKLWYDSKSQTTWENIIRKKANNLASAVAYCMNVNRIIFIQAKCAKKILNLTWMRHRGALLTSQDAFHSSFQTGKKAKSLTLTAFVCSSLHEVLVVLWMIMTNGQGPYLSLSSSPRR